MKITGDHKGVDVEFLPSVKLPKKPVTKDRYFVTDRGDTLTRRNPNRGTMFEGTDLGRASRTRAGD